MESAQVEWRAEEGGRPFLHPGRAASVVTGEGVELGWIGELHPLVLRAWELQGTVAAFELEVDLLHELTARAPSRPTATLRASPRCSRTSP